MNRDAGSWYRSHEQRIGPDRLGLRYKQAIVLEGLVVATELAHETKEPDNLRRMPQQRQVRARERPVLVAAEDPAPFDPPASVDELADVAVVAPHVVGAEIDRAVRGRADPATDVLRDEQERSLAVVEPAGAGQTGDPPTDDDRLKPSGQARPRFAPPGSAEPQPGSPAAG